MDFDSIINSSKNIVPKRLSFDFLNASPSSFSKSGSKKRKYSEVEETPLNVSKGPNDTLNSSTGSLCASWETKLLRSDLIEAQTRVRQIFHSIPAFCLTFWF